MKTALNILLAVLFLFPLTGCEDNMFLRSKKKMKQELQGTWKRNHLGDFPSFDCEIQNEFPFQEYWIFNGDMLHVVYDFSEPEPPSCTSKYPDFGTRDLSIDTITSVVPNKYVHFDKSDTNIVADFSIDADIFKAFLNLTIISGVVDSVNPGEKLVVLTDWEFVELDDGILYLAGDNPSGSGAIQREFYKVQ
ncbi:MAG: hypothetical protein ACK5C5_04240 [Bacteroidota bacterium]